MEDECPPDHAVDEQNIAFSARSCRSRGGFNIHLSTSGAWNGVALRVHLYERIGEATRLLILDNANHIFDSAIGFSSPILTFAGDPVEDFSVRVLFNRCYITPHDGEAGYTGRSVYVYNGTYARLAAGVAPSAYTLGVADGAAGKIEKGHHLFAVCFKTDSDHITPPGLNGAELKDYNAPGVKKANVSAIPLGPTGTVGRYIIATKVLGDTYNGNPKEQAWFFVPDGYIGDNTTQTITLDFYDADLLQSADYLQYQKETIPAGVNLLDYNGKMILVGDPTDSSKLWISNPQEVESFSNLDGFCLIGPGDGGGCKNGWSQRGVLYVTKSQRLFSLEDNGAAPTTWVPVRIDSSIGAECFAVGRIRNAQGAMQETTYVADRTGLYIYPNETGSDEPLTWKIHELWDSINKNYFFTIQIFIDPARHEIYINAPIGEGATEPNCILVGNFKNGMTKDAIRWSQWTIGNGASQINPTAIWIDVDSTTKESNLRFGSSEGSIWKYVDSEHLDFDGTEAINSYINFGHYPEDNEGMILQFTEIKLRIRGGGVLVSSMHSLDAALVLTLPDYTLVAAPGIEVERKINITGERAALAIQTYDGGPPAAWFELYSWRFDTSPIWRSRPG